MVIFQDMIKLRYERLMMHVHWEYLDHLLNLIPNKVLQDDS